MYLKIINFKCPLQGCAFLASITYLILHLGNIQEILDFVNMYSLFKNRSASCICGNYLSVLTTQGHPTTTFGKISVRKTI